MTKVQARNEDTPARRGEPADEPDWYAAGCWRGETLWASFASAAAGAGRNATVRDGDVALALPELLERARRIAGGLAAAGVTRGGAVLIQSRNCLDAYAAILACFSQGFVAVPLPPMFSPAQVGAVAASAEAAAVILLEPEAAANVEDYLGAVAGAAPLFLAAETVARSERLRDWAACIGSVPLAPSPSDPDADAIVLYSSGSTGAPKGVVHSGNSMRAAVESLAGLHRIVPQDRILVALEFGFVGGTVLGALLAFLTGASAVLMRRWDAAQCLEAIESHGITYTLLMPTHCYDLVNHADLDRRDTTTLTRAIMAGATPEQRRLAAGRLCGTPLPMYGMSESIAHCTCAVDDAEFGRNETDGRPIPGTGMKVLDEDGRHVGPGEAGNIFLRGPNRLRRYQARPELTAQVIDQGGWFSTGDRGRFFEGGFMTFVARASELIRRGGVMIQPAEIEAALRTHTAIAQLAVVGVPDERLGERACACVVLATGADFDTEAMRAHLAAAGLPRYQWPEFLLVFDEFPRTPSLKVRRADLRALAGSRVDRTSS